MPFLDARTAGRLIAWALLLIVAGCAGTESASDSDRNGGSSTEVRDDASNVITAPLTPAPSSVRTIQLYRTGEENSLPVIALNSGETLTLEFDLVRTGGRSFSVHFYHADRRWQYDLQPAQYMGSFGRDDLVDYSSSRGTRIPYTHYSYRYPNDDIQFTESGNYVVRVTEQGNEDEILFERAFFVSEQAVDPSLDVEAFRIGGGGRLRPRPTVRFPASNLLRDHPFDVTVCFMRNGHTGEIRCANEPSLIEASYYRFGLPMQESFSAQAPTHVLDLSVLQESSDIVGVDHQTSPVSVSLARDYARFTGLSRAKALTGQSLVESVVRNTFDPDTQAEYVTVRFTYLPVGSGPLNGSVMITGSFNNWQYEEAHQMSWRSDPGVYEGSLLIKQGVHEYRYHGTGEPTFQERDGLQDNLYTALVYFHDTTLNSDRLIAVRSSIGR